MVQASCGCWVSGQMYHVVLDDGYYTPDGEWCECESHALVCADCYNRIYRHAAKYVEEVRI